ncbi:sensor histidine kinase, partial [bacterium]|nr:sensor histidine kinase [bacterium]
DWLRSKAKDRMSEALQQNNSIDLVFAQNDEMATGAYESYKVKSNLKKPLILGIDALSGSDGGIQKVISGIIDATFIYPTGGEKAVQIALRILRNEPYDKENILYTAVVDKTNARVLKLQTDQIVQHQQRIGQLNTVLDKNLTQYSTQRTFLFFSLIVLFIITALSIMLLYSYRHKNRVNKELEKRNIAINKQKEELSEQRDQLLTLSKNLEEATQAKLVFFTNISHEFRTPLTLLYGPLESILKNEKLSNVGSKLAHIMRKNVQILMKLIDQIIEFRRYENGKMQTYFILSDLNAFVGDICNSFMELAKKRRIHFWYSVAKDDFTLWFDSDK